MTAHHDSGCHWFTFTTPSRIAHRSAKRLAGNTTKPAKSFEPERKPTIKPNTKDSPKERQVSSHQRRQVSLQLPRMPNILCKKFMGTPSFLSSCLSGL